MLEGMGSKDGPEEDQSSSPTLTPAHGEAWGSSFCASLRCSFPTCTVKAVDALPHSLQFWSSAATPAHAHGRHMEYLLNPEDFEYTRAHRSVCSWSLS